MTPLHKLNELAESHGELRPGHGMISGVIALALAIPLGIWAAYQAGRRSRKLPRGGLPVLVVVTVALGIASVLIVSVVQKTREIGILRAVGTPPRRVLAVFLIQGGVLGLIGSFCGSALGVAFAKGFEVMTSSPDGAPRFLVQVDLRLVLSATALATGVGLLAAVIPARRAARLDPATAIRGG